jgi:hypothetical protein
MSDKLIAIFFGSEFTKFKNFQNGYTFLENSVNFRIL